MGILLIGIGNYINLSTDKDSPKTVKNNSLLNMNSTFSVSN